MARKVQDFGRFVPGAAKHREAGEGDPHGRLGIDDIFPDRKWQTDPLPHRSLAMIRAMRDSLPAAPSPRGRNGQAKRLRWELRAKSLAKIASEIALGRNEESFDQVSRRHDLGEFRHFAGLYERLGHRKSLAAFQVLEANGMLLFCKPLQRGRRFRVLCRGETLDELAEAVRTWRGTASADLVNLRIGTRKLDNGAAMICGRTSGKWFDLETAPSLEAAKRTIREERERLAQLAGAVLNPPSHRHETNRERNGPPRRSGDIDERSFMEAFAVSAQFGASLPHQERARELNDAHDAFMDLAAALSTQSRSLSFGGRLAIGFASRGKGGRNAAKAHFEQGLNIINLTRRAGAGSLGHEWFHGFDRNDDAAPSGYSSERGLGRMKTLLAALDDTAIRRRSRRLDAGRKAYWSSDVEIVARAFEAWLKDRLDAMGITNDYLVNILAADEWQEVDEVGLARYPYPLPEEFRAVDAAYAALFEVEPNASLRARMDPGPGREQPSAMDRAGAADPEALPHDLIADHPAMEADGIEDRRGRSGEVAEDPLGSGNAEPPEETYLEKSSVAGGGVGDRRDYEARGWFELDL